jgi:hypothetical protein
VGATANEDADVIFKIIALSINRKNSFMIDRAFRAMVAEDRATFTCIFGKYHIIFLIKK